MKHFLRKLSVLLLLGFPLMLNAQTLTVSTRSVDSINYIEGKDPSKVVPVTFSAKSTYAGYSISIIMNSSDFEMSTSPTGLYTNNLDIYVPGIDMADTTIYVRLRNGLSSGYYYADLLIMGGPSYKTVRFSGSVLKPSVSILTASIPEMQYVYGTGASAVQSFSITGKNLTDDTLHIVAPDGFEVSTLPTSGFASYLNQYLNQSDLDTTQIYVRMAAGKNVASFSGIISIFTNYADTVTIPVTGKVTPAPLEAPIVHTPTNPSVSGFTANWSKVLGAKGYTINVYVNTLKVKTLTTNDPLAESSVITGIGPNMKCTYKVIALGNTITNLNSLESLSSTEIETLPFHTIVLCDTKIADWGAMDKSTFLSTDIISMTGDGIGFTATGRPIVNPTGAVGTYTGYISGSGTTSSFAVASKPLNYLKGAIVEAQFYLNSNSGNRTISLLTSIGGTNAAVSHVRIVESNLSSVISYANLKAGNTNMALPTSNLILDVDKLNVWCDGNTVSLPAATGYVKVQYYLPDITGLNSGLTLYGMSTSPIYILGLKYFTGIGDNRIVTCDKFINNDPIGLHIKGGVASTLVTDKINLKGYNLTQNLQLSVLGEDSLKFTLDKDFISSNDAMIGLQIPIHFIPSPKMNLSKARLKISSPELLEPFILPLVGITGLTPSILTSEDTIKMWSKLVEKSSYSLKVQGINIPYDVNLTLSGADANQFSISKSLISQNEILNGVNVEIQYLGYISPIIQNASLKISSTGISDIIIPIQGITQTTSPKMYALSFDANPKGSAIIETSPRGSKFPEGTKVSVKVTPEAGYKMYYWSDGKSGALTSRTVTVSNIKNGLITVNLKPTENTSVIEPISLVAYQPTNITINSFTASWSAIVGASNYTVTVYEGSKVVGTPLLVNTNSVDITGLNPGVGYTYKVKANTGEESVFVGPFLTTPVTTSSCTK